MFEFLSKLFKPNFCKCHKEKVDAFNTCFSPTKLDAKYELTKETMNFNGVILHRIKSLKDMPEINVEKGQLGGWIENEKNLSHEGLCWIFNDAKVCDNGQVCDNGRVYGNGVVYDNGVVSGNGEVCDNGRVFENGKVYGNGQVFQNGKVYENGQVFQNGKVFGNGVVRHNFSSGVCLNITTEPYNISYSGVNEKGEHFISVGCQCHRIEDWENPEFRNGIIRSSGFPEKNVEKFLLYLQAIKTEYNIPSTTTKSNLRKRDKNGRFEQKDSK